MVLGGELHWSGGQPVVTEANLDWAALREAQISLALALRVAPYAGPFSADDATGRKLLETARALLAQARRHGVPITEFQLDFDCASRSLEGYAAWLRALRSAIRPVPLVITTLPAWLDRAAFARCSARRMATCSRSTRCRLSARPGARRCAIPRWRARWVAQAARWAGPSPSRCRPIVASAGYDPAGRLLSRGDG